MAEREINRLETLLTKIIKNEAAEDDWECLNRLEKYLICILTRKKDEFDKLGEPLNGLEYLLRELYNVTPENAVEILSARIEEVK